MARGLLLPKCLLLISAVTCFSPSFAPRTPTSDDDRPVLGVGFVSGCDGAVPTRTSPCTSPVDGNFSAACSPVSPSCVGADAVADLAASVAYVRLRDRDVPVPSEEVLQRFYNVFAKFIFGPQITLRRFVLDDYGPEDLQEGVTDEEYATLCEMKASYLTPYYRVREIQGGITEEEYATYVRVQEFVNKHCTREEQSL